MPDNGVLQQRLSDPGNKEVHELRRLWCLRDELGPSLVSSTLGLKPSSGGCFLGKFFGDHRMRLPGIICVQQLHMSLRIPMIQAFNN